MRLALARSPSFERAAFIASPGNAEALAAIHAWPAWPGGKLALVGPEGSGKTHLARVWASIAGARILEGPLGDHATLSASPTLLEDADRRTDDAGLFHLINRADAGESLLLTARLAPRDWLATLPDLRSRLNALRVVALSPPDDGVLRGVLLQFFRMRNIKPEQDVLNYLARRIERSVPAARDVVARIDEAADQSGREITRALAREVLEAGDESLDLFNQGCGTTSPDPEGL